MYLSRGDILKKRLGMAFASDSISLLMWVLLVSMVLLQGQKEPALSLRGNVDPVTIHTNATVVGDRLIRR